MHVVHVCGNISVGGVATNVSGLANSFADHGVSNEVIGLGALSEDRYPGLKTTSFPRNNSRSRWGWNPELMTYLQQVIEREKNPIVHVEGVWMAPHLLGARRAFQNDVPFVLSPHGQISSWILRSQGAAKRIEKALYWRLVASRIFGKATICHALTDLERDDLNRLLDDPTIRIIPNSVNMANYPIDVAPPESKGYLLFLGRLHPVKGIETLIESFETADISPEWRLVIAGPSLSERYSNNLKSLAANSAVADRIEFIGPVYGSDKRELVQGAWCQIVPSYSEAIGNVNLEAGASQTPTITTHRTGLRDWEDGGGLLVEPDGRAVREAIESACGWSLAERLERGKQSRDLVQMRYSHEATIPSWVDMYESVLS